MLFHLIMQRLAGPVLDSKYAKTITDVDALLKKQPIGVQLATDGWKRKNVNEAQKVQNFIANFPDGGSSFLTAHGTDGCTMDNHEYERILTEQIVVLGTSVFYSHDMCSDIGLEVYVMVWGCF